MSRSWSDDPWHRYPYRWRDEHGWTQHVSDGPNEYLDPPGEGSTKVAAPPVQRTSPAAPVRRTATAHVAPSPWYRTGRSWLSALAAVVVLILMVRSCGGDDETVAPGATTVDTAPTLDTVPATDPVPPSTAPAVASSVPAEPPMSPTLLAFLPTVTELPAGWVGREAPVDDDDTPDCLGTALNGTGVGDADPVPAEWAEAWFAQPDTASILTFVIYRGDLDLTAVAERVKTCSGVADADGSVHQISDVAVSTLGQETYALRQDVTAPQGSLTLVYQAVKANGYVILGATGGITGTEDQALLEQTMALVAGRAV